MRFFCCVDELWKLEVKLTGNVIGNHERSVKLPWSFERLMTTMEIIMIAATFMAKAITSSDDTAGGGNIGNCIATWCVLKCVVYHV